MVCEATGDAYDEDLEECPDPLTRPPEPTRPVFAGACEGISVKLCRSKLVSASGSAPALPIAFACSASIEELDVSKASKLLKDGMLGMLGTLPTAPAPPPQVGSSRGPKPPMLSLKMPQSGFKGMFGFAALLPADAQLYP